MMFCENVKKNRLLQFYVFSLVICLLFSVYKTDRCPQQLRGTFCWWRCSEKQGAAWKPVIPRLVMLAGVSQQTLQWNVLCFQVVYSSKDPVWEEGFTFFVHSVKRQQLCVQVCQLSSYITETCLGDSGTWLLLKILLIQYLCLFAMFLRLTVNSNCCANKIIHHESSVTLTLNIKLTNKCFTFYETGKSFHVFYDALNQSDLLFSCPDQRAREENAAGVGEPAAESPPQHLQHGSGPAFSAGALRSQQPDQAESHTQGEGVHERRARAAMFLIPFLTTLQVLSVEKPAPKVIPKPPPQLKDAAHTSEGGQLPKAPPPVAASVPTLQASNGDPAAHSLGLPSHNGLKGPSAASHRGSMLAIDSYPTASTSNMRRFDSHSLLSENSIASSRFDVSEGAPYPEWVCPSLVFPPSGRNRNLAKVWKCGFRAIRNHQGSFGEIHLTIRYATLRNKLIIVVDACRFPKALS